AAVCGEEGVRRSAFGVRNDTTPDRTPNAERRTPILDCLQQLHDCSLIQVEERGGEVRYRLLETLREYAGEQLAAAGELAEAQKRHRDWYRQLAAECEAAAGGTVPAEAPRRVEAELDHF